MPNKSRQKGMNLVEIMVVLLIIGIIVGVGAPALNATVARNNIRGESNRLIASLNFARSQAVNKQQVVTLQRKSATSNDWSQGWTIFSDNDVNGTGKEDIDLADGDILLKDFTPNPASLSILAGANGDKWISFLPSGRLTNAIQIAICNDDFTDAITGTLLQVNLVGRITTATIAAGDKAAQCSP
jgi:type IV fimbrial biogenesis protein FimT